MNQSNQMRVLVTGGTGLVGKNLQKICPNFNYLSSMKAHSKINLIDCTLRDGGYYNNWFFKKF